MHRQGTPFASQLSLPFPDVHTCAGPGCANVVKAPRKFCGRDCYHRSWIGRKKANRTGQYFTCEVCGDSFYRYAADLRKGMTRGSRARFCSKACENGQKSATNIDRTCPRCGKAFTVWASRVKDADAAGRQIFCSEPCRDAAHSGPRAQFDTTCDACGAAMVRTPATFHTRNFCSRACLATQVADWSRKGRGIYGHRADLDGEFFRSGWEANLARILRLLGVPYEFEPRTFRLPTGKAYRPDFLVAGLFWIEVKGIMTDAARDKIAAFRLAYPTETLIVIGKDDYKILQRTFSPLIPMWEGPSRVVRL